MKRNDFFLFCCLSATNSLFACDNLNLAGQWLSDDGGTVVITQQGDQISGTYQYRDDDAIIKKGALEGTCQARTIHARWWEYPAGLEHRPGFESHGDLEWQISSDGKHLKGWYHEAGDPDSGEAERHDWNLER